MILFSRSWGVSFFSACDCFEEEVPATFESFASAVEVLTVDFAGLATLSFSRDISDAGSTCSASRIRPGDGLQGNKIL
jgi:hypothetical protein